MNATYTYTTPTKKRYINELAAWFRSLSEKFTPFATTVVFKSSGYSPRPEHWLAEYEHKFLWKLNKQISKRASELLFYHDQCSYEFGESSRYKSISDQRHPHHVHGVVNIPKQHVYKIWDQELNKTPDRLIKDFKSISNVSSVLIEPIKLDEIENWLSYTLKGKPFDHH